MSFDLSFTFTSKTFSLDQNYPGNAVLSALTEHPAMNDGLFHQLFDTQCKVKMMMMMMIFF